MMLSDLPFVLSAIARRFTRPTDPNHARLLEHLDRWATGRDHVEYVAAWQDMMVRVLTKPHWVQFLFPELCRINPDLLPIVTQLAGAAASPPMLRDEVEHARATWVAEQSNLDDAGSLVYRLLNELAVGNAEEGGPFVFLSRYYTWLDLLASTFVEPRLQALHERVFELLGLQSSNWPQAYCNGYLYQGWERIALSGVKPIDARLEGYGIDGLLEPEARVLDVGANSGMLAVALAERVGHVDAIELNPFLVEIGREVARHLGRHNVRFHLADIATWQPAERYDAVFSLANHCTIDGRMAMAFESYIAKLFALLLPGGLLFFESHNPFGPGVGGPGDDGDLDVKMEIAGRYFEILGSRMTRAFTPVHDIDKLFIAMRRRPAFVADAHTGFDLHQARCAYSAGPLVPACRAPVRAAAVRRHARGVAGA